MESVAAWFLAHSAGLQMHSIPSLVGGDALVRAIIPAEARFVFGRLRITLDDRFPTIREECP
jgi:hypothetical protein